MAAQKTTLARTPSSLLRSPTLRSSLNEDNPPDEKKTRHSSPKPFFTIFFFFSPFLLLLLYIYFKNEYPFLSSIVFVSALLALCFILASRSGCFRFQNRNFHRGDSVEWFIGEEKKASKKIVREGVEFYSNGDVYEGEFHKGRCNGSGVYSFFGHGRYEGDWIDGKYDGFGIESWARGSRYRGQYRRGLRHGFGVYRFFNGDCYAGGWLNGQSHGIGVQSCSDGSSYVGEFNCGVKHGLGCYHFRNGDRYSGEYFADKINGFGVYHFANGHCYEGSWHEGRKQGFGTYVFRNGDSRSGEWDCGVLKSPHPASDPSVLHAIHAARKAVKNAALLPRVDDQVNKAVAAANRSATAARVAAVKAVQNRTDGRFCDIDV
ncbi:1-phosphatidylinositol-4-phosphate 5-kinase protein [Dioscorea alata]|uniref:1-phosphatidylinositol-4-phosphate 5-kinase protein n=1 Tax=Dioscorea alata TaxID=55571 RepID=A0ACB7U5W1_DIOAL|nr:1-phosphatidylinositol-4-phosphate 5-kinase protein [Dioscorea alata]